MRWNQVSISKLPMIFKRCLIVCLCRFYGARESSKMNLLSIKENTCGIKTPCFVEVNTTKPGRIIRSHSRVHYVLSTSSLSKIVSAAIESVSVAVVNILSFWKPHYQAMKRNMFSRMSNNPSLLTNSPNTKTPVGIPYIPFFPGRPSIVPHKMFVAIVDYGAFPMI
jgi:hypothetical protein